MPIIIKAIDDGELKESQALNYRKIINAFYKDKTALHYAVSRVNRNKEVKLLCSLDFVEVNKADKSGTTPLAEAARLGLTKTAEILLKHPKIEVNNVSSTSHSAPLSEAVKLKHQGVIKLLCLDDRVQVRHKDWETKERQEEMFESPCFYPLLARMAKEGCNRFDMTKRNASHGDSIVHMAVLAEQDDSIEYLCGRNDIDFSAKNNDNKTAFDMIFPDRAALSRQRYESAIKIAQKIGGHIVITRKDDQGRTVLDLALELSQKIDKAEYRISEDDDGIDENILFFLAQPGLEINNYQREGKGIFHILKDIASNKSVKQDYLTEKSVPEDRLKDIPFTLEKVFETADDKNSMLDELDRKIKSGDCTTNDRLVYSALINITVIGLQEYAESKRLQYILYKGSVFKTLVKIFVDLNDEKAADSVYIAQLLRVLYISMQANIKCDCIATDSDTADDDVSDNRGDKSKIDVAGNLKQLESVNELGSKDADASNQNTNHTAFAQSLIKTLGEPLELQLKKKIESVFNGENDGELSDVQLIAKGIHVAYFEDNDKVGSFDTLKEKMVKASECLTAWTKRFFHKCICRSEFAFIFCLCSIFFHASDIVSDGVVGFKTLNGFSKRLGLLMIVLVFLTLVHENIRSVVSAYETERDLLRISLGKIDLSQDDFEKSELNYYESCKFWVLKYLGRFFWTYKVRWGTWSSKDKMEKIIRPLLFNFLSILMLRPIVDRLIVLTHQPSHLRALYRQQSKQKSLNQYYMILEQMPELLIQFYVFQIYFNNMRTPEDYINFGCDESQSFTYKKEYFVCVENLFKLEICTSWWEIYSMLVPFVKIPNSMVSLEEMFRKLSPETPKMSAAASRSLYLAYILMIPSRLFLFAAVMHSAPNHFYVAAYMAIVTLLWLVYNTYKMIQARNERKNYEEEEQSSNILDHGKTIWSLLLFTIRDVTLISLRQTDAYLLPPSEVRYKSLRIWRDVLAISSYFFIEGVVGAVYVERYYPCGRNTEMFKYQGWLYLVLLIISVTMIALLAYILQPTKINIIPRLFPHRAALICSFGLLMWFIAAGTFVFTTKNTRADVLLPLIITTIILMSILLAIVVVLRFFSEAKQKNSLKDKKSKASKTFSCLCCCSKQNAKMERLTDTEKVTGKESSDMHTKDKQGCTAKLCRCCFLGKSNTTAASSTADDQHEMSPMLQV